MKRAAVLSILLVVVLFAIADIAPAQQTKKVLRIGLLDESTASGMATLVEAFRQEMSKLGWIEGKNITIEYRFGPECQTQSRAGSGTFVTVSLGIRRLEKKLREDADLRKN